MKGVSLWVGIFLLSVCVFFTSCSNDEDGFKIPSVPGVNLQKDEVQIVFRTSPESYQIEIKLVAGFEEGEINWGDKSTMHPVVNGIAKHAYPAENKTYIITAKVPELKRIDIEYARVQDIIAIYAGDCPELMYLPDIFGPENQIEALDVAKCPKIEQHTMFINKEGFDLSGLKNIKDLTLYIAVDLDVDINNFASLENLSFFLYRDKETPFSRVKVENCPELKVFKMKTFMPNGYPIELRLPILNTFSLNAPNLNELEIWEVQFKNDLDLSAAGTEEVNVDLYRCAFEKKLLLNPATQKLDFSSTTLSEDKELNLSNCESLKWVKYEVAQNFETIRWGNHPYLESINISMPYSLTTLYIDDLPSLQSLVCWHGNTLTNVTIKNLENLKDVMISVNMILKNIEIENVPSVSSLDIMSNSLDENALISIADSLPGGYLEGKRRILDIRLNPGTKNVIGRLPLKQGWEVIYY